MANESILDQEGPTTPIEAPKTRAPRAKVEAATPLANAPATPSYPKAEVLLLKELRALEKVLEHGLYPGALAAMSHNASAFVKRSILDVSTSLRNHPNIAEFEHLI